MTIWFDMDGTLADLYGVNGWLEMLRAYNPKPYAVAKPLVNMSAFARLLNNRQRRGYKIAIVSALAKGSTPAYDTAVMNAKLEWLKKHLPSVKFDKICFVPYTAKKNDVNAGNDILFDDEVRHLEAWTGTAVNATEMFQTLKALR